MTHKQLALDLYSLAQRRLHSVGSHRELSVEIAEMCIDVLRKGDSGHRLHAKVCKRFADKHGPWDAVSSELDAIIAVSAEWAARPGSRKVLEGLS